LFIAKYQRPATSVSYYRGKKPRDKRQSPANTTHHCTIGGKKEGWFKKWLGGKVCGQPIPLGTMADMPTHAKSRAKTVGGLEEFITKLCTSISKLEGKVRFVALSNSVMGNFNIQVGQLDKRCPAMNRE